MKNVTNTITACALTTILAFGSLATLSGCGSKQGAGQTPAAQAPASQPTTNDVELGPGQQISEGEGAYETEDRTTFSNLATFTAKTADGKTFTQDDLAKADVTIVTFWSLGCGACMEELSQVASLQKTLPSNVQVISVCADDYTMDGEVAQAMKDVGFEGTTLESGDGDLRNVVSEIQYVPTTIAVDSTGKTVGTAIVGASGDVNKEFTQLINEALKQAGKDPINAAS